MRSVEYIYPPEVESACNELDQHIRDLRERKAEMTAPIDAQIERLLKVKAEILCTTLPKIVLTRWAEAPSTPERKG